MNQSLANKNKIVFLNSLRGIAALLVVVWHLGYMFWNAPLAIKQGMPYLSVNHITPIPLIYTQFINFLSKYNIDIASIGVALFFLISGFVISLSLEKVSTKQFIINRIFRLYPTYIIGFSLTFLSIYLYTLYNSIAFPYSFHDFLLQASLFRDWAWSPNIDLVSWTLETEIKFYMIAAIFSYFKKLNNIAWIIGVALFMCLINFLFHGNYNELLTNNVAAYTKVFVLTYSFVSIIFMFIGVCFYNLYKRHWSKKSFFIASCSICGLFLFSAHMGPIPQMIPTYQTNYMFALALFSICYQQRHQFEKNRILDFLADISYPLYVIHGVNGYIFLNLLEKYLNPYLSLFLALSLSIITAYLIHIFVESPFNIFGKKLSQKASNKPCIIDNNLI